MIKITSRNNTIIKESVKLVKSSKDRERNSMFSLEGARLCADSPTGIFRLFYTEKAYDKYRNYIDLCIKKAEEVYIIDEHISSLLSSTKTPQGVFSICHMPKKQGEIKGKILVMENLQDPGNIGTVLRTGEALGIDTFIFLGDTCDIYSPKVTRSSMGAITRLNFLRYETLSQLNVILEKHGYSCFSSVPHSNAIPIYSVDFPEKTAVFIGNEGNGLSEECIESYKNITIPMRGKAESLNASSAASIIMWEMIKNSTTKSERND